MTAGQPPVSGREVAGQGATATPPPGTSVPGESVPGESVPGDPGPGPGGLDWQGGFARARRRGMPLSLVLVGGVIGLLVVAMTLVFGLTFVAGLRNTTDLLIFSSEFLVQALEDQLGDELAPAAQLAEHAAAAAAADRSGDAAAAVAEVVAGAMAVTPQVVAVVLEERLRTAAPGERLLVLPDRSTAQPDAQMLALLRELAGRARPAEMRPAEIRPAGMPGTPAAGEPAGGMPVWGDPVWLEALQATVLPVAAVAPRPDGGIAAALALVSLSELGDDLAKVRPRGGRSFVIYDGVYLAAAEGPTPQRPPEGDAMPLPRMVDLPDPVFRALGAGRGLPLFPTHPTDGFRGLYLDLEEDDEALDLADMLGMAVDRYVVLARDIAGVTPRPLTVAIYFREDDVTEEITRLWRAGMAALAVLAVAALLAYLLSILITRPVRLFAANARRVAELRLDAVRLGRPPAIREFREAADAFLRMLHALRWFESYVPKPLVRQLIDNPELEAVGSQERVVTVMFTDIRGFTAMAERMPAREAAALLNDHFEMVNACVEAEEGTVDKYIGDCVMAFWGAPRPQADQAARALRAAQAIRAAQAAENARRRAAGEPVLRLRIGIHTGRAIVGNIGARQRVNYTVIGDVVNIASRLESLGKSIAPEADFCILASDAVLRHCGEGFAFRAEGRQSLRGREGAIGVNVLL